MSTEGEICKRFISLSLLEHELPRSESAVRLLCMIAAHESGGFRYVRQIKGPALGLLQMEPATYKDVSDYGRRKGYLWKDLPCDPKRMVFDFKFAVAMARIFFLRIPEPIPEPHNIPGLACYAKKYWNTEKGKATPDDYRNAWIQHFSDS